MTQAGNSDLGEKLVVRRGRVGSVDLFEVKENELDLLENGSPASLQLNFAIFLLSLAFSSVLTLTTATVKYPVLQTVYIMVAVVGFLLGLYLLCIWWKTQTSIRKIVATIRKRIPPEVVLERGGATPGIARPFSDQSPAG